MRKLGLIGSDMSVPLVLNFAELDWLRPPYDDAPVPAIGWDYRTVGEGSDAPEFQDYVLEQPLQEGSFVSVTLAWDREVALQDANRSEGFDLGETFADAGLNNLNIYLMRVEDDDISDSVWSSVSEVDSVEHIFHEISETGQYKIRVVYGDRVHAPTQDYALAWWTVPAQ
ncbi:MAG: hypothetical protein HC840_21935 [Leptolyngbyaceae cyanobacterium RM2_2_4]|nr:hypothetical protein [Leptolyngbyaceae cyanobacterium RM2_2_4]